MDYAEEISADQISQIRYPQIRYPQIRYPQITRITQMGVGLLSKNSFARFSYFSALQILLRMNLTRCTFDKTQSQHPEPGDRGPEKRCPGETKPEDSIQKESKKIAICVICVICGFRSAQSADSVPRNLRIPFRVICGYRTRHLRNE
jgi:hypothetical protein